MGQPKVLARLVRDGVMRLHYLEGMSMRVHRLPQARGSRWSERRRSTQSTDNDAGDSPVNGTVISLLLHPAGSAEPLAMAVAQDLIVDAAVAESGE